MNDSVNRPSHYQILDDYHEVIDIIRDRLGTYEPDLTYFAVYCYGNVLKYLLRAPCKNGEEDYRKAKVYMDWLVAELDTKEQEE